MHLDLGQVRLHGMALRGPMRACDRLPVPAALPHRRIASRHLIINPAHQATMSRSVP